VTGVEPLYISKNFLENMFSAVPAASILLDPEAIVLGAVVAAENIFSKKFFEI
jgi:nitrogen fixation/metabolism regulation signal transduction histidine kinase